MENIVYRNTGRENIVYITTEILFIEPQVGKGNILYIKPQVGKWKYYL